MQTQTQLQQAARAGLASSGKRSGRSVREGGGESATLSDSSEGLDYTDTDDMSSNDARRPENRAALIKPIPDRSASSCNSVVGPLAAAPRAIALSSELKSTGNGTGARAALSRRAREAEVDRRLVRSERPLGKSNDISAHVAAIAARSSPERKQHLAGQKQNQAPQRKPGPSTESTVAKPRHARKVSLGDIDRWADAGRSSRRLARADARKVEVVAPKRRRTGSRGQGPQRGALSRSRSVPPASFASSGAASPPSRKRSLQSRPLADKSGMKTTTRRVGSADNRRRPAGAHARTASAEGMGTEGGGSTGTRGTRFSGPQTSIRLKAGESQKKSKRKASTKQASTNSTNASAARVSIYERYSASRRTSTASNSIANRGQQQGQQPKQPQRQSRAKRSSDNNGIIERNKRAAAKPRGAELLRSMTVPPQQWKERAGSSSGSSSGSSTLERSSAAAARSRNPRPVSSSSSAHTGTPPNASFATRQKRLSGLAATAANSSTAAGLRRKPSDATANHRQQRKSTRAEDLPAEHAIWAENIMSE